MPPGMKQALARYGLWARDKVRVRVRFTVKVRIREMVRFKVRIGVSVMVRVTIASVLECTSIRNLHLATAATSCSGHESSVTGPTFLMSSRVCSSGERPPCTQRNCWFMIAASGRQSNASMHASYTFSEYFILPTTGE